MNGFTIPNHTQTPNALFDDLMRDMTEAELKVTLAVVRKTLGYHKQFDPISYSQIMEITGLSRSATQQGIDLAIQRGLIEIVDHGKRGVNVFGLVVNSYQSEIPTTSSSNFRPLLVVNSDTQKKSLKENKRKESTHGIHPLIQSWATIRNIDAINIGAPIYSPKDTASAKRMAKWETPPTTDEIRIAITSSKVEQYPFLWLETDIPKGRLAKATTVSAPVNPAHVPFAIEAITDAVDMPPEAREALDRLKLKILVSDEAIYGKRTNAA